MSAYELTKTILKDSANLKAYYRFESGALTTDSSGNSNTLSAISDPAETTGVYGGGVALDSDDAYSIVDHASLKPTGAFTIGAWINLNASGSNQTIFQSYSQNTNVAGIQFVVTAAGKLNTIIGDNTGTVLNTDYKDFTANTTLSDGTTYHAVVTWDTATIRIYLNGAHDGSVASTIVPGYAATNYIRVGAANTSGTNINFFNGMMDDLFVLNGTALSADQIKELYEGRYIGEWMPQANLVGLWHLNGNSTDVSGNNNHGTDTSITYSLANGKIAQGAGFNGSSSGIDCGNPASLQITGALTLNCWCKVSSLPGAFIASVGKWNTVTTTQSGYYLGINSGNKPIFLVGVGGSTANQDATGSNNFPTNSYVMLTGVYVPSTSLTLYINGAQIAQNTTSIFASIGNPSTNLRIGRTQLGNYWTNTIDEVSIFSRALTASEIRKWYAWSSGRYL